MDYEIRNSPSAAAVYVHLAPGEAICAESGAMVHHSDGLKIATKMVGGLFRGLVRKFLGGESVFQNIFAAGDQAGSVSLAPTMPGDIAHTVIDGQGPILSSGAYLASAPEVTISPKWTGWRTFFGGEGLIMLATQGKGDLFFNSFGAIREIQLDGALKVDTGHVLGFEPQLQYRIRRVGGWKSTFFSGEGIVMEFEGKGKLWLQTRHTHSWVGWIVKLLPGK